MIFKLVNWVGLCSLRVGECLLLQSRFRATAQAISAISGKPNCFSSAIAAKTSAIKCNVVNIAGAAFLLLAIAGSSKPRGVGRISIEYSKLAQEIDK